MSEEKVYPVPPTFAERAHVNAGQYRDMYRRSVEDPEGFWAEQAERYLHWERRWERVLEWDFHEPKIRWFEGGVLNASYNCLDRHLESRGDQTAIIWEGDEPGVTRSISYRELHSQVCRLANVLKEHRIGKGDRVAIYMPMIPEAAVAMLACARIGAIHSVVFGGFSPEALKDRILDADCKAVITADGGNRGGRLIRLKDNVDQALAQCPG
ncbi:MAG: acetyl-coenzyme A synthetase, partial [Gammaproteobacteria bacterium]